MSPETVVFIAIAAFLILILIEVPVGIAVGFAGLMGIVLIDGHESANVVLATTPFSSTAKYALFVVPMYVLLGCLVSNAGIGTRIYRLVYRCVRFIPGGLPATAVIATSAFSGISGSSAADVATFGRISVTEMMRHGYKKPYAAAVVAAAGTFAALIPPSVVLVIYGVIAGIPIGAMILAAVVPGILSAVVLVLFVVVSAVVSPNRHRVDQSGVPVVGGDATTTVSPAPAPASSGARELGQASIWHDLPAAAYGALLFGIVVGGLYAGIFTATEAGAVGAFAAVVVAVGVTKSKHSQVSLRWVFSSAIRETSEITSMIFLLIIGGAIFTYFIASAGMPAQLVAWVLGLPVEPIVVVALLLLALIPLGMFLDGLSIMLLTVPLAAPVVAGLDFNEVWFAILVIKAIEIGLITPPVGINVFIISSLVNEKAETVFRYVVPFILLDIAVGVLLFAFPEIVLWLPETAGYVW